MILSHSKKRARNRKSNDIIVSNYNRCYKSLAEAEWWYLVASIIIIHSSSVEVVVVVSSVVCMSPGLDSCRDVSVCKGYRP